jgi:electron transport complex protein RnfA
MTELFVILVATVLVNNFVLMRFLGLCPFMGVSRNLEAATGMSLATAFVLVMSNLVVSSLRKFIPKQI